MVIHSPRTAWDYNNLDYNPGGREAVVERVHATLKPAVRRAEDMGCVLVIKNIEDIDTHIRVDLARSFDSPAVRVSIDTGHANYAHGSRAARLSTTMCMQPATCCITCTCRTRMDMPTGIGTPAKAASSGGRSSARRGGSPHRAGPCPIIHRPVARIVMKALRASPRRSGARLQTPQTPEPDRAGSFQA